MKVSVNKNICCVGLVLLPAVSALIALLPAAEARVLKGLNGLW